MEPAEVVLKGQEPAGAVEIRTVVSGKDKGYMDGLLHRTPAITRTYSVNVR